MIFDEKTGEIGGLLAIPPLSRWASHKKNSIVSGLQSVSVHYTVEFQGGRKVRDDKTSTDYYQVNADNPTGWRVPMLLSTASDLKPKIAYASSVYNYELGSFFQVPEP